MKVKQFKERFKNKHQLSIIILGSLTFMFLLMAIYQSFATYNLRLSEMIIDAKVGSMYDIRILGIYIDDELQPGMSEFPTDIAFSHVRCYVDGEYDNTIIGEWLNDKLTIKGFKGKTDCNVYFERQKITVTFIAGGTTLSTPAGCVANGNNRICTCAMTLTETSCSITSPTITVSGFTVTGFGTSTTATSSAWNSNTASNRSADATFFAIRQYPALAASFPATATFIGWVRNLVYGERTCNYQPISSYCGNLSCDGANLISNNPRPCQLIVTNPPWCVGNVGYQQILPQSNCVQDFSYSCPSGSTLSGQTCNRNVAQRCATHGGTLSGSNCFLH